MMLKKLYFDIETSLMECYTFYIGNKVHISHNQIKEPKKIICICYKWAGDNKIHSLTWNPKKESKSKESKMLNTFNNIAKEADVLVAYNGQGFDVREIRSEIALRQQTPWCETEIIDPYKDYRRLFRFASNKLDAIAKAVGLDGKNKMELQDWINISNGCEKSLSKMVKYCKQDVKLLEQVDLRLQPYIKPTVKTLTLSQKRVNNPVTKCNHCDSKHLVKYGVYKYKNQSIQKYLCKDCYKISM